jgi:hypothetical protein
MLCLLGKFNKRYLPRDLRYHDLDSKAPTMAIYQLFTVYDGIDGSGKRSKVHCPPNTLFATVYWQDHFGVARKEVLWKIQAEVVLVGLSHSNHRAFSMILGSLRVL